MYEEEYEFEELFHKRKQSLPEDEDDLYEYLENLEEFEDDMDDFTEEM